MSTVQIAISKVKGLSSAQAKDLLVWLSAYQARRSKKTTARVRHKRKRSRSMRQMMAWYDSIRGSTDWEPPRMPEDLVHRVSL